MIIDACAFLGRNPFARSINSTSGDLVHVMDKTGIDRALVTPLAGAFYSNAQESNEEALVQITRNGHRLTLVAAVNPSYPGWEKDVERSVKSLHAVGLRLFPGYHGYDLASPEVSALAETAGKMGLPVFVSVRLWDERQHPPCCMVPAVPASKVAELAVKHPKTSFVLSMARFGEVTSALKAAPGNLVADVAGVQGPVDCMRKLAAEVGAERLLFGTELMIQYGLPSRYKIDYGHLSESDTQRIYEGNISRILGAK